MVGVEWEGGVSGKGNHHGDGHDGWVGDVDCADHVRPIGFGGEFDTEFCDVEAGEFVQA